MTSERFCADLLQSREGRGTPLLRNKISDEDLELDLRKQEFGTEYREVLDKLLKPKLPDNRELRGRPSYEYAQKAMKAKGDRAKYFRTPSQIKHLRRGTKTTLIRDMI
mmetsp:Transcript_41339/g.47658  ORF Transcript_41339/g.47658 Transcript_41339/m.47658 type:complete len:108 (-) Transcript_41339:67-390(-)